MAFDWKELVTESLIQTEDEEQDDPEFRYLANDVGIQPNSRNNYGIPQDVINIFKASSATETEELNEEQLININRLVIDQIEDETRRQETQES